MTIKSKLQNLDTIFHKDQSKSIYFRGALIARSTPLSYLYRYHDDGVFLIGSGPSVSSQDISRLTKKTVFLMNGTILLTDKYQFKQVFYVVTDHKFIANNPDICLKALESRACCIFSSECIAVICERFPNALKTCRFIVSDEIGRFSNANKPDMKNMKEWTLSCGLMNYDARQSTRGQAFGFSEQLDLGYFNCGTVMYAALQFSICLTPKTIYLMGFDIANANQPRFYETYERYAPSRLFGDFHSIIKPAFELASKVLEKKQIRVFNLSTISLMPGSIVPVLDFNVATEWKQQDLTKEPLIKSKQALAFSRVC